MVFFDNSFSLYFFNESPVAIIPDFSEKEILSGFEQSNILILMILKSSSNFLVLVKFSLMKFEQVILN
tara:strand:- start:774 stop:977 length:204 start_codon:yes stop_codon:yes gene_type:complete